MYSWMTEYLLAFQVLNQTRQVGFSANPIPISEILAYIQVYGASDPKTLVDYILEMDGAYLEMRAKKAEKNKPPDKAPTPNGKHPS
ncbi:hypothetical protein [Xanthomonas phage Xp15]|uniref:Uncharacterized protein n=1 Tax=Xanthomonas phage Xp15 TaxID=322855 RepID=Q52PL3_9CAUD|nr:hypothetical protein XPXV15_gp18 [Xanthomonas phage Xp15]AAX84917.1 hypothetical protein [Xanthomonas phage Xp15]